MQLSKSILFAILGAASVSAQRAAGYDSSLQARDSLDDFDFLYAREADAEADYDDELFAREAEADFDDALSELVARAVELDRRSPIGDSASKIRLATNTIKAANRFNDRTTSRREGDAYRSSSGRSANFYGGSSGSSSSSSWKSQPNRMGEALRKYDGPKR